ncbi:MAG: prepilin peptidase, partial [bacterium]
MGLIIGSFLNVCICRIPRGESIVLPASRCPKCRIPLKFYDNIPVISYIFLRGHCRGCGEKISMQYPVVEFLTCVLFLAVGWRFGPSWPLIPYLVFTSSLIIIAFIDIEHLIIPDIISLPGILSGLLISFLPFMSVRPLDSLIGIFAWGGCFWLIAIIGKWIWKRDAMGGGDIKLIAMIAAFLGWRGGLVTVFWASLIGSIWGGFLMLIKKKGRKDLIPFGPFLCLGALISLLYGPEMIQWYKNLLQL